MNQLPLTFPTTTGATTHPAKLTKTSVDLRGYQREFCGAVWRAFFLGDQNHEPGNRCLGTMGTGGGKTRCAGALGERFIGGLNQRVLFLADTDELVDQANRSLERVIDRVPTIEKANLTANLDRPLAIASIDSLSRQHRLDRFPRDHYGLVIADEAHLAVTKKWTRTLNHFETAKILGITATPQRSDRKNILSVFDREVIRIPMERLIREGWLAPITVRQVPIEIDMTSVDTSGRDLSPEELDAALEPYFDAICEAIKEHAGDRKILVFCPLVKTSQAFVRACIRHGISAKHVHGQDPDRYKTVAEFRDAKFQLLSNPMMLTKGYDDPSINCIIVLRLTKSPSLYQQMIGRGTRLADGKTDLLVLDFLWSFGDMMKPIEIMRPANLMSESKEEASALTQLLQQQGKLNIMDATDRVRQEREEALMEEIREKARKRRKARTFDYLSYCATVGSIELAKYEPMGKSENSEITTKQAKLLAKIGVDARRIKTRGHASMIIGDWFQRMERNLATPKQLNLMLRLKIPHEPGITFEQASQTIDHHFRAGASA